MIVLCNLVVQEMVFMSYGDCVAHISLHIHAAWSEIYTVSSSVSDQIVQMSYGATTSTYVSALYDNMLLSALYDNMLLSALYDNMLLSALYDNM